MIIKSLHSIPHLDYDFKAFLMRLPYFEVCNLLFNKNPNNKSFLFSLF